MTETELNVIAALAKIGLRSAMVCAWREQRQHDIPTGLGDELFSASRATKPVRGAGVLGVTAASVVRSDIHPARQVLYRRSRRLRLVTVLMIVMGIVYGMPRTAKLIPSLIPLRRR
jgi:hypothetical protein